MPTLSLPDGAARSFGAPVTGADLAASIGPGLAKAALLVEVDGELRDLSRPIAKDSAVRVITARDADALEVIRHDAAHLLAEAVKELYPDVQVTIGPAIEDGFYYDFARDEPFTRPTSKRSRYAWPRSGAGTRRWSARSGRATTRSKCSRAWASTTRRS